MQSTVQPEAKGHNVGIIADEAPFPKMNKKIVVAIDFDETITTDPKAWLQVMQLLNKLGMEVYVVTYRYNSHSEEMDLEYLKHEDCVKGIVFTGRRGKKKFCEDHGINVDIWIDDNPITITHTMSGIDAFLNYNFVPDEMTVSLIAKPRHIEQAQYETKVMHLLPRPKH